MKCLIFLWILLWWYLRKVLLILGDWIYFYVTKIKVKVRVVKRDHFHLILIFRFIWNLIFLMILLLVNCVLNFIWIFYLSIIILVLGKDFYIGGIVLHQWFNSMIMQVFKVKEISNERVLKGILSQLWSDLSLRIDTNLDII